MLSDPDNVTWGEAKEVTTNELNVKFGGDIPMDFPVYEMTYAEFMLMPNDQLLSDKTPPSDTENEDQDED